LSDLIRRREASVEPIVSAYVDYAETGSPVRELLLRELERIKVMAMWAKDRGKTRVALEIG
jgi:hypothetical protein